MLDTLCLTGEVGWARLSPPAREATQVVGATPVALVPPRAREGLGHACRRRTRTEATADIRRLVSGGRAPATTCDGVQEVLRSRGASFVHQI